MINTSIITKTSIGLKHLVTSDHFPITIHIKNANQLKQWEDWSSLTRLTIKEILSIEIINLMITLNQEMGLEVEIDKIKMQLIKEETGRMLMRMTTHSFMISILKQSNKWESVI